MINISIFTAGLVIYFLCLRQPVSGRPTESSSRPSTAATSNVADIHSPQRSIETEDASDEFQFETNEYPDHYDLYDNSDSADLSDESSELETNGSNRHNLSQLNKNTLDDRRSHTVGGRFSGLSNATDRTFDQSFQASKRNSGSSYRVPNNLQEAAVHSVPPAHSADVGSVRGITEDSSSNSHYSEDNDASTEFRTDDPENSPHKREDVQIMAPTCSDLEINDTTDGRDGMLPVGEASVNGQVERNQIQPCGRFVNTDSHEQQEWIQSSAVADTTPMSGQAVLTPHVSPVVEASTRDHTHPVVIDEPDLVHLHHTLSSDAGGGSENPGMLEEGGANTSSPNSNNVGSITSNVVISDGVTNSSESTRLNIHVPGNDNVPANGLLPVRGASSDKTQDLMPVIDQPDTQNLHNGAVVKPNENSNQDQLSQSAIHPSQSFTSLVTATLREDFTPSTRSVHLSVSSRYVTLSLTTLAPSNSNVILQTSYTSNGSSYTSNGRLIDEVNGIPNTFTASPSTSSINFPEALLPQTLITRLSPSEPISDTPMTATTTPLLSPQLLFPTHTEHNTQPMKTPLYQPTMTFFRSSAQSTTMKLNAIDEEIDSGPKVYPEPTNKIGTTLTTSGLFTSPTSTVVSSASMGNAGNSAAKVTTYTTKVSTASNLLPSSPSTSKILTTSIVATATSTIVATTAAVDSHEYTVTTSTFTRPIHSLDTSTITTRPLATGTATSTVTLEMESIRGNTTSSDAVEPESPSSFMELKFGMSWPNFCQNEVSIRGGLVEIMQEGGELVEITPDQLQLMNREKQECFKVPFSGEEAEISVRMYLMNKSHHFDRRLTLVCAKILVSGLSVGESSVIKNKMRTAISLLAVSIHDEENGAPATGATIQRGDDDDDTSNPFSDPGVIIAVALASVGGCYCLGLVVLQIIVRHRSRSLFSLGLSYSATSSDSIQLSSVNKSRPNSGLFNPGLDITDSLEPSNPLTVIQLATFCVDEKRIHEEYQKIPSRMPRMSVVPAGDEDKNRYANILPLVNTRVKLQHDGYEPRSSYINANYITGPKNQSQYYIATQAPTDQTTSDFWAMVWQQGCGAIVMLTQLVEDGQVKCASYWPELVGKSAAQRHGHFLVELKHKDVHQEYIASKLEINNLREIETKEIDHFWYTCWPAIGVPEPISLVKLVLDTRPKYECSNSPLVVHCSPGTGRTCTFIALDLCMRQFEERRVVDVMRTVYVMRQERAGAIQNKEQYTLLYNSLNEYATIVISPAISAASSATTLHALLSS